MDTSLVRQFLRHVNNMDSELADVTHKILSLDSGEKEILQQSSKVKKVFLGVDLKVEWLLPNMESTLKISTENTIGIHLPKISDPSINGNILNWIIKDLP